MLPRTLFFCPLGFQTVFKGGAWDGERCREGGDRGVVVGEMSPLAFVILWPSPAGPKEESETGGPRTKALVEEL